jgi:hypothetical protein
MKRILATFAVLIPICSFSQNKLPVIKATSSQAKIYEQDNPTSNWTINPKLKLDIHSTGKLTGSKIVKFKTDLDSISFKLRPGQKKDFIVLLNGKDSCLTEIRSSEVKNFSKVSPKINDTIPFFINKYNTNLLPIVFNGTDSIMLNFDTGATGINITTDALKTKVKTHPKLHSTNYDTRIGGRTYKSTIDDLSLVGNEADGLLGWDVFDGMVIELDYDSNKMIVHSKMPKHVIHDRKYSKFKIRYIKNKPYIQSDISQSGTRHKSWFMFDLGYQRTVMLDKDLLQEAKFATEKMKVINKIIMHGARGNDIPVITSNLESLKLGRFELNNVPAQVLGQNKPVTGVNVHILGSDVLKRFNTVLDFQKNVIYLKPNHLYDAAFAYQKKNGV